ncbi:MAG: hypothetical protein A2126_01415 [Candidatus Woykebacteria bacterium GWB1_45_5]|uniref:5'-deoxynucleotidase n=1 Tax=Candidatus Woykebacteria bacterium GWB1_45_5 TaxID=1802592 RepID=A0A1G1W7R1_9BACT|nr:MAG: hypothetical protein A2126_01415 [Candidatus Woykebacteria bacterium GWB1_45_5]
MEEFIRFFIEVGKLKSTKRPGWVLRGIKNPETVADHAFRVLILAWVFGKETNLNHRRLLKLALVHSLSAVYINYISPYDKLLETKSKKELLKKYPALVLRAPIGDKWKIARQRFEEEQRAIRKLTQDLPEPVRHEIDYLWLDFQQRTSKEAKFLKALDRLENLIQALEYKDQIKDDLLAPFLSQIGQITDNKRILGFAQALCQYFTKGEKSVKSRKDRNLIKFILEVGKLKTVWRKGWLIRGVKNPESIASHSFRTAFMSWMLLGRRRVNFEAIIVMSMVHDLSTAVIGDFTPYDKVLEASRDKKRLFETLPWLGSRRGKSVLTMERLQIEAKGLDKTISFLPQQLRQKLKYLWLEYKTGTSREARLTRQIDRVEDLIQAMEYYEGDKSIPVKAFWLELKELVDDSLLAEFVDQLDYYFLQQSGK